MYGTAGVCMALPMGCALYIAIDRWDQMCEKLARELTMMVAGSHVWLMFTSWKVGVGVGVA